MILSYRKPFDWGAMLGYLARRATPGTEAVTLENGGRYRRTVRIDGHRGYVNVVHEGGALRLEASAGLLPVLIPLQTRLRHLFDLDVNPQAVSAHLSRDPALAPLVARRPGLRVPGALDGFELALRAVLGQQVTVRGASTLAGRLALLLAEPLPRAPDPLNRLPVTAQRLAEASIGSIAGIGLPRARATCIIALARAVAAGELPELSSDLPAGDPAGFERRLRDLPGIGPWTASYVAMRALHWPDSFPEGDAGLRKAMGGLSAGRLRTAADAWRPWRSYAAQHLWASLGDRGPQTSRFGLSER
jgi:AraC family transcriptional regulator of adaptative response / DNA-3-methyladenine glycosylase II